MIRRMALILVAFALTSTVSAQTGPGDAEAADEPAGNLRALADCSARKFETTVVVDGLGRGKKVTICGKPGQSDSEWLVTLRDSAEKVEADAKMTPVVKEQILTALKAEIDRISIIAAPPASTVAMIEIPTQPVSVPEAPPQYSRVPSLPAPKPRAAGAAGRASEAAIVKPRLTVRCALPSEAFGDCARMERETQLLIRADEDLASGTGLRFLRGGDERAELDLGPLRKGESLRQMLPARICSGVLRGKVQVQVLSKNRVAETLGPYTLYCGS